MKALVAWAAPAAKAFALRLVWTPEAYQEAFRQIGEFRITVHVTADNAKTQALMLRFTWKGDWKDYEVSEWS